MDSAAMSASGMASITGATADAGLISAEIAVCRPAPAAEMAEYIVRCERSLRDKLLSQPSHLSMLIGEPVLSSGQHSHSFKMDWTPPRLLCFDTLSTVLRI